MPRSGEPPVQPGRGAGLVLQRGQQKPSDMLSIHLASKLCPCPLLVPPFCKTLPFLLLLASPPTPFAFYSTTENVQSCQWLVLPLAIKSREVTWLRVFPPPTSPYSHVPSGRIAEGQGTRFSPLTRILSLFLLSYVKLCVTGYVFLSLPLTLLTMSLNHAVCLYSALS